MVQARDLFGIAVRILGIWYLCQAGYYSVFLFMALNNMPSNSIVPASEHKLFVGFYLLLAFIFLVLAEQIVKLIYGPVLAKSAPGEIPAASD